MLGRSTLLRMVMVVSLAAAFGMGGCTKKPNQEEMSKLEQAKQAAEGAETKLKDLRTERQNLEAQLEKKKQDLKGSEDTRDSLKTKMGK